MAAEGTGIKERATLKEGLEDRVTLGVPLSSPCPSSSSMPEAPVTPLTCRESARAKASSLTPLTDISCHSCYKSEFDRCCSDELSEKFEGEKTCSTAETPETNTFDPFAAGRQELIFAPKKPYKTREVFDGFAADIDGNDCPFDKPSSPKKVCKSKESISSVARVLYFDDCLDTGDENRSLGSNGSTEPNLANKGLHCPHLSQALLRAEETQLKHQYKIPLAASLEILNQENESQASAGVLNVSSRSRSGLVRVLDLDYDKHLVVEEHCMKGLVGSDDKPLNSAMKDALLEETFVEAMCGSFLQAILSKQCEDANMNCTQGSNEENGLSIGQDQSTPSTPVTYQALSSAAGACPGAPTKTRSKMTIRGTSLGSVCRKLEF
ncbi:hypothetical protein SUGI_0778360 [Cryptomeria japonica]|nr:hypothetical protein SUGI_0778360 [Cryptomeria japonica]